MPQSNGRLKAIMSELERRRATKATTTTTATKSGNHLVAVRLNEYVPPPFHARANVNANANANASANANGTQSQTTIKHENQDGRLVITPRMNVPTSHNATTESHVTADEKRLTQNIICQRCGHCRCQRCRSTRQLPNIARVSINDQPCTVDALIDTVTCMRLVRSASRHASRRPSAQRKRNRPLAADSDSEEEEEQQEDEDEPESLRARATRWSVAAALGLVLPCVACYWPLRGVKAAATKCYNSPAVRTDVCRCRHGDDNLDASDRVHPVPGQLRASFSANRAHHFVRARSVQRPGEQLLDDSQVSFAQLRADKSMRMFQ